MKVLGFGLLIAALWSVALAEDFSDPDGHFVSQHGSRRNGRGKKVTGKKHGSTHGNGMRKIKGLKTTRNFSNTDFKERNRWLTPTEACASHETEEGEVKPLRAPLACRNRTDARVV